ncbi:hypothetical protein KSP40_PGU001067 [Platanthera guangdongensis]|uniref:Uncharacterized protein n=1 Tax=Platanthera guangdongensis TaxID=2320717 RepID=A0ABR2M236_9ASPA
MVGASSVPPKNTELRSPLPYDNFSFLRVAIPSIFRSNDLPNSQICDALTIPKPGHFFNWHASRILMIFFQISSSLPVSNPLSSKPSPPSVFASFAERKISRLPRPSAPTRA